MWNTGKTFALVVACLGILTGCGGNDASSPGQDIHSQARKFLRTDKATATTASDYQTVVQELYVSYFGRPADPSGLANFEAALLAANAPTDIQGVNAAYATTPAIQSLVNSFGTSAESQTLYGSGDTNAFVTAVFQNVLGRPPQQAGLTFWSNAIDSNLLSQGDAALAIMAGALANTTAQGLLDGTLINNRITVAGYFTSEVTTLNALSGYVGNTAAATARSMLSNVTATTNTTAYQAIAVSSIQTLLHVGTITPIAGMQAAYLDNNGLATGATLSLPTGVAADAKGNVYIADMEFNVVRKVAADGTMTVVAGNGISGFAGDGGPAVGASLDQPSAVAVDSGGNLYIADTWNGRIRKVASNGTISTVAGNGGLVQGYSGDNGPAVNANLFYPQGVAVDAKGNIFIADTGYGRIHKVDTNGIITTVAGVTMQGYTGDAGPATSAELWQPCGVAVDTAGNLYIADTGNNVIREINAATGIITTVAGDGTRGFGGDNGAATGASLSHPTAVTVDAAGNLYIADTTNNVIRKVGTNGTIATVAGVGSNSPGTFAGDNGPASSASLNLPQGVAIDAGGNVYIADTDNNRTRKVAVNGIITTIAGGTALSTGDNGPATSAIMGPSQLAFDSNGNIYISDVSNHVVRKINAATGVITTVAGNGIPGNSGDNGSATSAQLSGPGGIALDAAGNIYIADSNVVRKVNAATGIITTIAGNGVVTLFPGENGGDVVCSYSGDNVAATSTTLCGPDGLAIDSAGDLYIADLGNARIRKVTAATGIITTVAGNGTQAFSGDNGPATSASIYGSGVALDGSGNIYIADTYNNAIRKVNASTGVITTIAGNGTFGYSGDGGAATSANLCIPGSVAIDSAGNVYIADSGNARIRKVTAAAGIITTVAGNGIRGNSGDGGTPGSAELGSPVGIAFDTNGNLYIADGVTESVRVVWGLAAPY